MLHTAFHLSGLNCLTSNIRTAVSICADTVILSGLMPCLSDHPQQTSPRQLTPPPSASFPPPSPASPPPFPVQRPVPLLSQSLPQLRSFPSVPGLVTLTQPLLSPPVVTALCLHRHWGWCQGAPSRRSPASYSFLLPFSACSPDSTGSWSVGGRVCRRVRNFVEKQYRRPKATD